MERNKLSRHAWWALTVVYVTMFAMAIGNVIYTQHVDHSSNRKWCVLMTNLNNAYKANPPTTPAGLQIARDVETLLIELDC